MIQNRFVSNQKIATCSSSRARSIAFFCGITTATLHSLRHTAAYRMAQDPALPLTDVQAVLGHAQLTTTQIYLTPRKEDVIRLALVAIFAFCTSRVLAASWILSRSTCPAATRASSALAAARTCASLAVCVAR